MRVISVRTKFCSRKCKDKAHSIAMMGAGNSNYSGRSKPYFGGLWMAMQPLIRERDGNMCAVCDAPPRNKALPVHHIDEDPGNDRPENLITLCHRCHTVYHRSGRRPFCLQPHRLSRMAEERTQSMTSKLLETITSLLEAYSSTTA